MRTIFTIIFLIIIGFDIFMVTPFGAFWTISNLEDDKPCYGLIIMFIMTPIAMVIGGCLGIIK